MTRTAGVVAVIAMVATTWSVASADVVKKRKPIPPAPPPGPPDAITDDEAREANLESNGPREGFVFAGALGFGVLIGGDIGVGRGPAISLRFGHVATQKSVITFELVGSSGLHKRAMDADTLSDTNFGLFAGVQHYTSPSLWVRLAGGLDVFVADTVVGGGGMAGNSHGGFGTLVGGGFDLARWGYLVLGFETFAMGSITGDGFKFQLGFATNLTYY